jgi:hypothetical protein
MPMSHGAIKQENHPAEKRNEKSVAAMIAGQ